MSITALLFAVSMLTGGAQLVLTDPRPVTPDGLTYIAPTHQEGYAWASGVRPIDPDAVTIPYDGKPEWEVFDALHCKNACGAFIGCEAFVFTEPRLLNAAPTCRMLSDVTEVETVRGSHLYQRR